MEIKKKYDTKLISLLLTFLAIIFAVNALIFRYPFEIIVPLIKAVLLFLNIYIYGFFIMRLMKKGDVNFPAFFAVGLIFTTVYFYLIGMFGILSPVTIWIFYLVPLLLIVFIFKSGRGQLFSKLTEFFKRPATEYLLFLFPLIYASLPSSFYDTLVFHLGIPNFYIQNSGFIGASQFLYANTSIYYEISLIPSVFAGDMVPRLFHFFIGITIIYLIIDFSVEFFNLKKKKILLLIILSLPVTALLITTVKNDLVSALFILLGIKFALKGRNVLSAVFWGFSIGVKYTNVIPLILFFVMLFFRKKGIKLKVVVLIGIIIFLVIIPLLLKNFLLIGNPVYPFLNSIFKAEAWDISRHEIMRGDAGGIFHSFKDVLKFPYDLSFRDIGGIAGPIFLIFLPFTIVQKRKKIFLLLFALILLFVGPYFKMSIRCWYVSFLILSVYIVLIYEQGMSKILNIVLFFIIGLNFLTSFALLERYYVSNDLLSGKMDKEQYKGSLFPTYPAISFVNKNIPVGSKVLIVGESRNYYLKRPYMVASPYDHSILYKYLMINVNAEGFKQTLRSDGFSYIIFNEKEFNRLQEGYKRLAGPEVNKFNRFIESLIPVFSKNGLSVFKI